MPNWLTKLLPGRKRSVPAEGSYRPGPYLLSDGWLSASAGRLMNWWQCGYSLQPYGDCSAMVEACVSAYAQTVAMCPGDHWRSTGDGGRERVTNSALSRVLRRPNDYQSASDFLLNLTRSLYSCGEAFAVATRNDRGEVAELHLMRYGYPYVAAEDGSIFYSLSGNDIVEHRFDFSLPVPSRDVLHVRLQTPRNPLKGESPILAAALDIAMSGATLNQQIAYYINQARPSFMLETDEKLTPDQTAQLRQIWDAQTKGENAGGTPILAWGLKAKPVTGSADDGQLAEMLKMTDTRIASVFRVPLSIVNLMQGGGPQGSTEALMQFWVATGLGFALNHIEVAFDKLFGLRGQPLEYSEFDTAALLRSNFRDRIEAMARSVVSGIHSSDEARAEFELPATPGGYGSEPRLQAQVVPLSAWDQPNPMPTAPSAPSAPSAPTDGGDKPTDGRESHGQVLRFCPDDLLAAADAIDARRLAA